MIEHILHIFLLFFSGVVYSVEKLKLTAVNDSPNVVILYSLVGNKNLPSESDTVTDLQLRNCLCHNVIGSGYFRRQGIQPINYDETLPINKSSFQYLEIFQKVYSRLVESQFPYNLGSFKFADISGHVNVVYENVVLCLAEVDSDAPPKKHVVPFYISKEYNLNHPQYKPARFVFEDYSERSNPPPRLILAEEPAVGDARPDLSIELLYLQIREHHILFDNDALDPLCKMVSPWQDPKSQLERLCAAVLGSMYFENKELYPRKSRISDLCEMHEITFQTAEGVRHSATKSNDPYQEWMILCEGENTENKYYISRSYSTNQVFVYHQNRRDGKIYLENLTTNVFITDEDRVKDRGSGPHKRKRESLEESNTDQNEPDSKTNRKYE